MATAKSSPKGSNTTEIVIGRAANKLQTTVASFKQVFAEIDTLATKAEELQEVIAQREERLAGLDVDFQEKKRAFDVQFALDIKAAKNAVLEVFMENEGLVAVSKNELAAKVDRLTNLEKGLEKEITTEVAKQVSHVRATHENEKRLIEATNTANEATTKAQLEQKNNQIAFLESQVTMWKEALDAERAAGVERAKAGAIGSINLTGASK